VKYPNGYFRPKQCRTCSVAFVPEAPSQLYCSVTCRGTNSYYLREYGVTERAVLAMMEKQGHRCAICGGSGFVMSEHHNKLLVLDHCHATGTLRQMLCHNCNRGLGLFQDNPDFLRAAARYLTKFRKVQRLSLTGVGPSGPKREAPTSG
jgi:hypothetical protein